MRKMPIQQLPIDIWSDTVKDNAYIFPYVYKWEYKKYTTQEIEKKRIHHGNQYSYPYEHFYMRF